MKGMGSISEATPYQWTGRGGPFELLVGRRTFAPSRTSEEVAEGLEIRPGDTVIDVGCGSGVLSFVAAQLGARRVYGTGVNVGDVRLGRLKGRRVGLKGR